MTLRFLKWRIKKSQKVVSKSLVLNSSKWVHIVRSSVKFAECLWKFWLQNSQILWGLIGVYHTLLSCIFSSPHFWARCLNFGVNDLLILIFCNCALKTEWLSGQWNYTYDFFTFFFKIQKTWLFNVFLSCCTRFSNTTTLTHILHPILAILGRNISKQVYYQTVICHSASSNDTDRQPNCPIFII